MIIVLMSFGDEMVIKITVYFQEFNWIKQSLIPLPFTLAREE